MTQRPITPDRWESGGTIAFDDAQAKAAAEFRRRALAGGFAVAAEDGTILQPGQQTAEVDAPPRVPAYIELHPGEAEHTIVVTDEDGTRVELEIMTKFKVVRKNAWLQQRLTDLTTQVNLCGDDEEEEADRLLEVIARHEDTRTRGSIPNLPEGLLGRLDLAQYGALQQILVAIAEEAQRSANRQVKKALNRM